MTLKQRQHLLAYLGYYIGAIDDDWGSGSREACRAFQRDRDLTVDGYGGPETDKALRYAVGNDLMKPEPVPEEDVTDINVGNKTGTFWDGIVHFSRNEMRCKCGGRYCNGFPAEPQQLLMELADRAREHFGRPAHVVSGLRCSRWNAIQGGVANSQHMYGEAMDIRIDGVTADTLLAWMKKQPEVRYCYKINSTNVHFDIPKGKR